jgi:hypothetical protein
MLPRLPTLALVATWGLALAPNAVGQQAIRTVGIRVVLPDEHTVRITAVEGDMARIAYEGFGVLGFAPKVVNAARPTVSIAVYEVSEVEFGSPTRLIETVVLEGKGKATLGKVAGVDLQLDTVRVVYETDVSRTAMSRPASLFSVALASTLPSPAKRGPCCVTCGSVTSCGCAVVDSCGCCCDWPCCNGGCEEADLSVAITKGVVFSKWAMGCGAAAGQKAPISAARIAALASRTNISTVPSGNAGSALERVGRWGTTPGTNGTR